jgi:MFS transporter, putative metabolite:H+ symporter
MLAVNAGARLDRLPASRFHYRILALIGGGIVPRRIRYLSAGAVLAALIGIGWSTPAQNANFQGRFVGAFARRFANLAL